jgi:hypothetical protein
LADQWGFASLGVSEVWDDGRMKELLREPRFRLASIVALIIPVLFGALQMVPPAAVGVRGRNPRKDQESTHWS